MKSTIISKKQLKSILSFAKKAILKKSIMVVENVYFYSENGNIYSFVDGLSYFTKELVCPGSIEGLLCVSIDAINTINSLEGENVELIQEGLILTVNDSIDKYKFTVFSEDSELTNNIINKGGLIQSDMIATINTECVINAIPFVKPDDYRPWTGGIYIEPKKSEVVITSTDAYILRTEKIKARSENSFPFILPLNIALLLKDFNKEIFIITNDLKGVNIWVTLTDGIKTVSFIPIDAKYPDCEIVIPSEKDQNIKSHFLKSDVLKACKKAEKINDIKTKFTFSLSSGLAVYAEDVDLGKSYETKISSRNIGEEIEIGFNPKLMQIIMSACKQEEIQFSMSRPSKPATIIQGEETFLIMPTLINVPKD